MQRKNQAKDAGSAKGLVYEAVFISDLHLHPQGYEIQDRFTRFMAWIEGKTQALYILGDFFHVWAGDDAKR